VATIWLYICLAIQLLLADQGPSASGSAVKEVKRSDDWRSGGRGSKARANASPSSWRIRASISIASASRSTDRKTDLQPAAAEADGLGQGTERDGIEIPPDQRPELFRGDAGLGLPEPLDVPRSVIGLPYPLEELGQCLAFNQPGGTDGDGREQFQELPGGAGLQLKQVLEVAPVVVGANGVRDRAADLVQAGQPRDRAGHGEAPSL